MGGDKGVWTPFFGRLASSTISPMTSSWIKWESSPQNWLLTGPRNRCDKTRLAPTVLVAPQPPNQGFGRLCLHRKRRDVIGRSGAESLFHTFVGGITYVNVSWEL